MFTFRIKSSSTDLKSFYNGKRDKIDEHLILNNILDLYDWTTEAVDSLKRLLFYLDCSFCGACSTTRLNLHFNIPSDFRLIKMYANHSKTSIRKCHCQCWHMHFLPHQNYTRIEWLQLNQWKWVCYGLVSCETNIFTKEMCWC